MNESICKELFLIPRERIDLGEGMKTHKKKKSRADITSVSVTSVTFLRTGS